MSRCVPMGMLSDKVGRKPLIYLSGAVIVLTYIEFMFCSTLKWVLIGGAIYGMLRYLTVSIFGKSCNAIWD